LNNQRFYILSL